MGAGRAPAVGEETRAGTGAEGVAQRVSGRTEEDALPQADGGGRMRRRSAGDRAWLLRPLRAAGAVARGLRRVARRQQGLEHPEGGTQTWACREGILQRAQQARGSPAARD